jgi:hypothetical protein
MLAMLAVMPASAGLTFASSCPQTIAKGDALTISGTGTTNGSVLVLALGRQYFALRPANPDERGEFTITIQPEETTLFQSGQYAFVELDPGANGQHEIDVAVSGNGNITVMYHGTVVADLGPVGGLNANVRPEIEILQSISIATGCDDVITPYWFFVEEPFVHFTQKSDPVSHQLVLERDCTNRLSFSGTTNMGSENTLSVNVYNIATRALIVSTDIPVLVQAGVTEMGRNKELNSWNFLMDPAHLPPGEYVISVGWQKEKTTGTGTSLFTVPETPAIICPSTPLAFFSGTGTGFPARGNLFFLSFVWMNPQ